ncbi:hypothetical protein, partial [Aeromonas piscicola]|uniref:hypothetical protein n=1 Tax=Aeromonas piscicola TaxID=600645 RepID=UPI0028E988A8
SAFCLLPSAFCLLPSAFCLLPLSLLCHLCCLLMFGDTDCRRLCFVLSCFGRLNIYMFLWPVLRRTLHHDEAWRGTAAEQH